MSAQHCEHCHKTKDDLNMSALLRCSACKKVYYCCKEHQLLDWKSSHKKNCTFKKPKSKLKKAKTKSQNNNGTSNSQSTSKIDSPNATKMSDKNCQPITYNIVQINEGEGNGLANKFFNITQTEEQLNELIQENNLTKIKIPFGDMLGYKRLFVYVNTSISYGPLNGAAVWLTCEVQDGLSRYQRLKGKCYVVNDDISKKHRSITSDRVWGMLNFIYDMSDYYETWNFKHAIVKAMEHAKSYTTGTYIPFGGTGGINIYNENPDACKI